MRSSLFPVQNDFGIALAVSNTRHGQIHANLGALALEVLVQILNDFRDGVYLGDSDYVLGVPSLFFVYQLQLVLGRTADRALRGTGVACAE